MEAENRKPLSKAAAFLAVSLMAWPMARGEGTAATQPAGLDALNDDRLMAELSSRGLSSLLERTFEVDSVPKDKREGFRALLALGKLSAERATLSPKQRQEMLNGVTARIEKSLPWIHDPKMLMQVATMLIRDVIEHDVNTLEYWGEDPKTQSSLQPDIALVDKVLDECATQARETADSVAGTLRGPSDPRADRFSEFDALATNATYTRLMVNYYLCLSLDHASSDRKQVAQDTIEKLKQYDTAESGVQPLIRNRIAKLQMMAGDFATAKKTFKSVSVDAGEMKPKPDPLQQYEARYFAVQCDLFARKVEDAKDGLADLRRWQDRNLPNNQGVKDGAEAAAAILEYRILLAAADEAPTPAAKRMANNDAADVLSKLLKDRPALRPIIYEQLARRLPEHPAMGSLDPLMLQAIMQRGEVERLKPAGATVDSKSLQQAIEAARELVRRKGKGVDDEMADTAGLLIPFYLQRLGQTADAAEAALDYLQSKPTNQANARVALDAAVGMIAQLRKASPEDAQTVKIYERFLPIAIGPPYNRKEFAFEWGRRLQALGKYPEAVTYFEQVPPTDARSLQARFFEMVAMKQQLDDQGQAMPAPEKEKLVGQIQAKADDVSANVAVALKLNTGGAAEEKSLKSMRVRTALLAAEVARRESKNPQRAVDLLSGFEQNVRGADRENDLLSEALFIRVNAYMAMGKTNEATQSLVSLLKYKEGGQGASIVYDLLQKLNADLDKAREAGDDAAIKVIVRNRAALSGFLVDWAKNNPDPNKQRFAYRYSVFDADAKRVAGEAEDDAAARKQRLDEAHKLYEGLLAPDGVALYQKTVDPKSGVDPNYPDPAATLGLALTEYAQGNYKEAHPLLARLMADRKLGTAMIATFENGQDKISDNDVYWEAMYKLLRCNVELAKAPEGGAELGDTANYLKRLYVEWGQHVGGKKWHGGFEDLRKQVIPDFDVASPATAPVAAG